MQSHISHSMHMLAPHTKTPTLRWVKPTWLSKPRVSSMKKKRKDQKGASGSIVMACG